MAEPKIEKLHDVVAANLAGGWAGNTDAQVLTWLDGTVTQFVDVPWLEVRIWAHGQGIDKPTLDTQISAGTTAVNRTAAAYIADVMSTGQTLEASDQRVRDILNASALPSAAKTALIALASKQVPRHVFYGVTRKIGAIERARELSV